MDRPPWLLYCEQPFWCRCLPRIKRIDERGSRVMQMLNAEIAERAEFERQPISIQQSKLRTFSIY
jgi:hypothetical protein